MAVCVDLFLNMSRHMNMNPYTHTILKILSNTCRCGTMFNQAVQHGSTSIIVRNKYQTYKIHALLTKACDK